MTGLVRQPHTVEGVKMATGESLRASKEIIENELLIDEIARQVMADLKYYEDRSPGYNLLFGVAQRAARIALNQVSRESDADGREQ